MDKFLNMEGSGSTRVEKRGYELDADADGHPPEPKRQRLPTLARFLFFLSFLFFTGFYALLYFVLLIGANLIV